jgi:uncharacterized protein (DUF1800 family)
MNSTFYKFKPLFVILCGSLLLPLESQGDDVLRGHVTNGQFEVALPGSVASNELRMLEWSTNLVDWAPVARDYGTAWENTFPHALPVSTGGVSQILSDPTDTQHRFYRVVTSATSALNNSNSVSRFLQQATFGPTRDLINNFPGLSDPNLNAAPYTNYEAWIETQLTAPTNSLRAFWRERSDPSYTNNPVNADLYEIGHNPTYGHQLTYYIGNTPYKADTNDAIAADRSANDVTFSNTETKQIVWYQMALTADDVLRQKMAWALSQIFVVGEEGSNQANRSERWLVYYDIFLRRAFGNFRDILGEVTYSPHMGRYLTYDSNKKEDPVAGTFPDENYAREIMQLFTIGLWKLNQDGTPSLDPNGDLIPSYDNDDITEFARVFTGLRKEINRLNIEVSGNYIDPMRVQVSWHDFGAKTLLDESVLGPFTPDNEANVRADIDGFLDHLFNHANTPPFISRKLIQRFTVSNPSPQYIHTVAQAFIDGTYNGSGSGVRGDLGAVVKAILLHPEARESALAYDATHGRLREPLIRLLSYARAFEITSPQTYGLLPFDKLDEVIVQSPFDYPSVFNFYLPAYQPIGAILDSGLLSPEFQIHNDITALSLPNAIRTLVYDGISDDIGKRGYSQGNLDLTYETGLANDSSTLLDHLDMMLTAGRLTAANRSVIFGVIDGMPSGNDTEREARVQRALSFFALLPEFNVLY